MLREIPSTTNATVMTGLPLLRHRVVMTFRRLYRYVPRLVWPGQEVDVRVTFKGIGALTAMDDGWSQLASAALTLQSLGISFDAGSGTHGRDWEWDWSLEGPISVTFRDKAKRPDRRDHPQTAAQKPDFSVVA